MNKTIEEKKVRGDEPYALLYDAVKNYIESIGGTVVVAGGVELQHSLDDLKYNYKVAIKVVGKRPELQTKGGKE